MDVAGKIESYIASQPDQKRSDMQALHLRILNLSPGCKLWFEEGKDAGGKVVSNPTIGYGSYTIKYADGKSRDFFRIGVSGNTTGISVYIMGLTDKKYLPDTYGKTIGKASVTGYCIKFKTLKDIVVETLAAAIRDGLQRQFHSGMDRSRRS